MHASFTDKKPVDSFIEFQLFDIRRNQIVTLGGARFLSDEDLASFWDGTPEAEGYSAFVATRVDGDRAVIDEKVISFETCEKALQCSIAVLIRNGRIRAVVECA